MAKIQITENELKQLIRESVEKVLNEDWRSAVKDGVRAEPFTPGGKEALRRTGYRVGKAINQRQFQNSGMKQYQDAVDSYNQMIDQSYENDANRSKNKADMNFMRQVMRMPNPQTSLTPAQIERLQGIVGAKVDGVWKDDTQTHYEDWLRKNRR